MSMGTEGVLGQSPHRVLSFSEGQQSSFQGGERCPSLPVLPNDKPLWRIHMRLVLISKLSHETQPVRLVQGETSYIYFGPF